MSQKLQIQLTNPCTQSWEEMQTVPGGKFCSSCEKKVIDFTLLNDRQVLEVFRNNKNVCGRLTDEQLNRELRVTTHQSNAFIPAVMLSAALATGVAAAAYATKNIEQRLPLTEQDTLRPIEAIRRDTVISTHLVTPLACSADSSVQDPLYYLQGRMGGLIIGKPVKARASKKKNRKF